MRLEQVLVNLRTNAAKFTNEGGCICLSVEANDGGAKGAGPMAVIRVRDSGIGIAPELLPRIFDPFVQADVSPARTQGGMGIGLTLVQQQVKLHGGSVKVDSVLDKGSEFVVCLPVSPELQAA
jgi:signal transduction histidine kinase